MLDIKDMPESPVEEKPFESEDAEVYEDAEKVTGFNTLNRKRLLKVIVIALAAIVGGAGLFSIHKAGRKNAASDAPGFTAKTPEFLKRELSKSLSKKDSGEQDAAPPLSQEAEDAPAAARDTALPRAVPVSLGEQRPLPPPSPEYYTAPPQGGGGGGGISPAAAANRSPLVPLVEGSLFERSGGASGGGAYAGYAPPATSAFPQSGIPGAIPPADPYSLQNNQSGKQAFYSGSGGGGDGYYLADNTIWQGSIIPAVLETAVNTDLPGNVIARVTQNVYDSRTGKKLLVPQGTLLIARYNSSVSYAQHRIQIVWDTLIRPDGFYLDLQGALGVDREGMSGHEAEYSENWFEYLKAAGIIALFSIANAKLAGEAAKYGGDTSASGVASQGGQFVSEVGGNIISRAMNIQPTLTLDNGEQVNIMINKPLFLPPLPGGGANSKYVLK